MDYQRHYDLLIDKVRNENRRRFSKSDLRYVYYEKHHIIPRCLNGDNDIKNLVLFLIFKGINTIMNFYISYHQSIPNFSKIMSIIRNILFD